MSEPFSFLFLYTLLCLLYLFVYAVSRVKIKLIRWKLIFLIDLIYLIFLLIYFPSNVAEHFGISDSLVWGGVMTSIASIFHHFSILIHGKRVFGKIIDEVHGPISHTAMSVSLIVMCIITWIEFSPLLKRPYDITVLSFFVSVFSLVAVFGFLTGWKILKLWYK